MYVSVVYNTSVYKCLGSLIDSIAIQFSASVAGHFKDSVFTSGIYSHLKCVMSSQSSEVCGGRNGRLNEQYHAALMLLVAPNSTCIKCVIDSMLLWHNS